MNLDKILAEKKEIDYSRIYPFIGRELLCGII
jgi:hypothetical protein